MAQSSKEKIKCPKCGNIQDITVYRSINSITDEKEIAMIKSNHLFEVYCEECEEKIPLLYNCLYHDINNFAMYYLLPDTQENDLDEMNHILKGIQVEQTYRYRRVFTVNELREKILIAEQNLDDRIIELLKVVYLVQIAKDIGEKVVSEILFDVIDDAYYIEIFYEDTAVDPGFIILDMNIYKQIKEQYLPQLDKKSEDGFLQIDFEWAKKYLFG